MLPGLSDATNQAILSGMALEAKDRPQSMEAWLELLALPPAPKPPRTVPRRTPRPTSGCVWCGVDSLALDTFALLPFALFSFPSSFFSLFPPQAGRFFFSDFYPISTRVCQNTSCEDRE
ncbi:hypothetical protein [Coleofasciculus sp.]|uniref:hypothetical protein n=1 Tax=Coleofasciculus sp. TaxID=3100458 RepID=UPI003A3784FF